MNQQPPPHPNPLDPKNGAIPAIPEDCIDAYRGLAPYGGAPRYIAVKIAPPNQEGIFYVNGSACLAIEGHEMCDHYLAVPLQVPPGENIDECFRKYRLPVTWQPNKTGWIPVKDYQKVPVINGVLPNANEKADAEFLRHLLYLSYHCEVTMYNKLKEIISTDRATEIAFSYVTVPVMSPHALPFPITRSFDLIFATSVAYSIQQLDMDRITPRHRKMSILYLPITSRVPNVPFPLQNHDYTHAHNEYSRHLRRSNFNCKRLQQHIIDAKKFLHELSNIRNPGQEHGVIHGNPGIKIEHVWPDGRPMTEMFSTRNRTPFNNSMREKANEIPTILKVLDQLKARRATLEDPNIKKYLLELKMKRKELLERPMERVDFFKKSKLPEDKASLFETADDMMECGSLQLKVINHNLKVVLTSFSPSDVKYPNLMWTPGTPLYETTELQLEPK